MKDLRSITRSASCFVASSLLSNILLNVFTVCRWETGSIEWHSNPEESVSRILRELWVAWVSLHHYRQNQLRQKRLVCGTSNYLCVVRVLLLFVGKLSNTRVYILPAVDLPSSHCFLFDIDATTVGTLFEQPYRDHYRYFEPDQGLTVPWHHNMQ